MELILASKSERRKNLMEKAGYAFSIILSDKEKDITGEKYDDSLLFSCVESKLEGIIDRIKEKEAKILLADTVVVCDDIIIGKPKDKFDAKNILKNLSGKTHFVATAIMVVEIKDDKIIDTKKDIDKTKVTFRELSEKDIENYIDEKNPLDKAGAYGIQDEGFDFCVKIEGDIDNVIGLPIKKLENLLDK